MIVTVAIYVNDVLAVDVTRCVKIKQIDAYKKNGRVAVLRRVVILKGRRERSADDIITDFCRCTGKERLRRFRKDRWCKVERVYRQINDRKLAIP